MRRRLRGVLAALWICLGVLPALAAGSVPEQVIDAREQVYRVLSQDDEGYYSGSAFVVKADREKTYLATNYHVVQDTYASSIVVIDRDGQDVSASVVGFDVGQDVCLLETQRALPNAQPLPLSDQYEPAVGSAVYALGFPGAADYLSDSPAYKVGDVTLTDGIINAVKQATNEGQPVTYLQMSAAISHGNSGGPLLDTEGQVLGINTLQITDGNQIYAAVSVRHLEDLMARCNVAYHRGGLQPSVAWGWVLMGVLVLGFAAGTIVFLRRRHHRSLAAILKRCPPQYDLAYAQEILSPVMVQLRALHQQGRSHGAVSAENIYLDRQGKLRLGRPGKMKAGPFRSLELAQGGGASLQADVYALGALLFTLLTGQMPDDAMTRAIEDRLPDQLALVESVPSYAREALLRALALRPQDRTQNVYVFSEKLRQSPAQAATLPPSTQPVENVGEDKWVHAAPQRIDPTSTASEAFPPVVPYPKMTNSIPWHQTSVAKKKRSSEPSRGRGSFFRRFGWALVSIAVIVAIGGVWAFNEVNYQRVVRYTEEMQFDQAGQCLPGILIIYRDTETLHAYVSAGMEMQTGNYNRARTLFQGLKPYRASEKMLKECDYREALSLMNLGQFDEAKKLFLTLADYQDALDRAKQCDYSKAVALVEDGKYTQALNLFTQLGTYRDTEQRIKNTYYAQAVNFVNTKRYSQAIEAFVNAGDYSDAAQQIAIVKELAYYEGISAFEQGSYGPAKEYFQVAGNYLDATMYLRVLRAISLSSGNYDPDELAEKQYRNLMDLWADLPARQLIAEKYMEPFLVGNWRNGQNHFKLEHTDEGMLSWHSLPIYSGGKYYKIEGNTYYTGDNDSGWQEQWVFNIVDKNQIQVYVYKTGETYTLYRQ